MTENELIELKNRNKPFLLKPSGKDYLWGGRRLKDEFDKDMNMEPLAETWECSTHPDGASYVCSGEFAGSTLAEVMKVHPEFLGSHPRTEGELPIIIKLIDAKQDLSIQVHPNDEYAYQHENRQLGKSELWYVLDAAKDANLIYGLYHSVNKEKLKKSIENGNIEKYLQKILVNKDDVFYIKAGMIHAIGAGVLIAEIQENSNLTYRLYDYNRIDKKGTKRELHVEKALEAADLFGNMEPVQPLRVLKYRQGCAEELLCRCKSFEVHRMLVNTERCREMVEFQSDSLSFRVLLCIKGCGTLIFENGECCDKKKLSEMIHYFKGDCIFVPADSIKIRIHGNSQFLVVRG